MIYEFKSGAQTVRVELERDGDGFRARIGDDLLHVGEVQWGAGTVAFLCGTRSHVAHAVRGEGVWHVFFQGRTYDLGIPGAAEAAHDAPGGVDLENGRVMTPMPGRVVRVDVEEGQAVDAGQVLLILESMKMQNSIVSPVAGRIRKLHKAPGELVAFGEALVEIDPLA